VLSEAEQQRLAQFSAKAPLSEAEHEALDALRAEYGKIRLRKARAMALLRIRSGQRLLADTDAA